LGLSTREAATMLSESAAKVRLHCAHVKLKELVAE
jgi:hypothetical protein